MLSAAGSPEQVSRALLGMVMVNSCEAAPLHAIMGHGGVKDCGWWANTLIFAKRDGRLSPTVALQFWAVPLPPELSFVGAAF
jgi:hypothetical protein